MKPEPLKGKLWNVTEERLGDTLDVDTVASEEDIRSAINWLKDNIIQKMLETDKQTHPLLNLIDQAFEDVVKKRKGGV